MWTDLFMTDWWVISILWACASLQAMYDMTYVRNITLCVHSMRLGVIAVMTHTYMCIPAQAHSCTVRTRTYACTHVHAYTHTHVHTSYPICFFIVECPGHSQVCRGPWAGPHCHQRHPWLWPRAHGSTQRWEVLVQGLPGCLRYQSELFKVCYVRAHAEHFKCKVVMLSLTCMLLHTVHAYSHYVTMVT